MIRLLILLPVLVGLGLPNGAAAHNRSESFSTWQIAGSTVSMRFTVATREVTRIPQATGSLPLGRILADYVETRVSIMAPGSDCRQVQHPQPVKSRKGFLHLELRWHCDRRPTTLVVSTFFDLAAEHTHFARIESREGFEQQLLTRDSQSWELDPVPASQRSGNIGNVHFLTFGAHGFKHIISGLDHILFLLALLLICRRVVDLVWAITGFTLGHSVTLALAVLGYVQPDFTAIEAVIGLTIALVAIERSVTNATSAFRSAFACATLLVLLVPLAQLRAISIEASALIGLSLFSFCYLLASGALGGLGCYRIFITALFGMVHGFGFAGAFLTSTPGSSIAIWPLAAFNIGVELGQVAAITVMLVFANLLRRHALLLAPVADVTSAIVCSFGVFWFVQRSFA